MSQFIIFSIGFVVGAWIATLITALIASSHNADEKERRYWENRKENGEHDADQEEGSKVDPN